MILLELMLSLNVYTIYTKRISSCTVTFFTDLSVSRVKHLTIDKQCLRDSILLNFLTLSVFQLLNSKS